MPHFIMTFASPMLRRKLDFPPWFAPVMIARFHPALYAWAVRTQARDQRL
jgi:hypothetical protein